MPSRAVSSLMRRVIAAAGVDGGLTAYGFRYGRAQEMHEERLSVESIAEALGHDDISVTYGYIKISTRSPTGSMTVSHRKGVDW